jgi:hypothetical protein
LILEERAMSPTRGEDEKAIADLVEKYINENDVTWSFPNLSVHIVKNIVCFIINFFIDQTSIKSQLILNFILLN